MRDLDFQDSSPPSPPSQVLPGVHMAKRMVYVKSFWQITNREVWVWFCVPPFFSYPPSSPPPPCSLAVPLEIFAKPLQLAGCVWDGSETEAPANATFVGQSIFAPWVYGALQPDGTRICSWRCLSFFLSFEKKSAHTQNMPLCCGSCVRFRAHTCSCRPRRPRLELRNGEAGCEGGFSSVPHGRQNSVT